MSEKNTSDSVSENAQLTEKQIQATLDRLSSVWSTHRSCGIRVRHMTGRLLNRLLGKPSDRQEYGKGVIGRAAKQLGISRSEIYRMRKFADVVPNVKQFLSDRPQITTWTSVKVYLGGTNETDGQQESDDTAAYAVAGARRSLRSFVKRVQEWKSIPQDSRNGLRDELGDLFTALRDVFGVTVPTETYWPSDSQEESEPCEADAVAMIA